MNSAPPASADKAATERPGAAGLSRGVSRLLDSMGYRVLTEFSVGNHRRVDIAGVVLQQVDLDRYGRMGYGDSGYYYHYGRYGKYYSG